MNNTASSLSPNLINQQDGLSNLANAIRGSSEIATSLSRDVRLIYGNSLEQNYYQGGWSEDPKVPAADYANFKAFLEATTQAPIMTDQCACIIGSNKLWSVIDILCHRASEEVSHQYGLKRTDAERSQTQLISGITLSFELGDQVVSVYGGKNREEVLHNLNYEDKNIEISVGDTKYKLRAVSLSESSGCAIWRIDDASVGDRRVDAQKTVVEALRQIHSAVGQGKVNLELHFIDRNISSSEMLHLLSRIRGFIRP